MSLLDTLAGTEPIVATQPEVSTSIPDSTGTHPHVKVLQYDAKLDPQADAFLSWLWQRMKADDLVDLYFPGQTETGFTSLVELFAQKGATAALFDTGIDSDQWKERIPGFITWNKQQFGMAPVIIAGFIFFRDFWDHKTTDDAGRAAFDFWFKENDVEIVLGLCPSLHVVAQRYNKRIGLTEKMRLPGCALFKGKVCDAIVYGMTRDEWDVRRGGR